MYIDALKEEKNQLKNCVTNDYVISQIQNVLLQDINAKIKKCISIKVSKPRSKCTNVREMQEEITQNI